MSSERVLIWLKYRFIGDAVLATPLLRAVASKFSQPHVLAAPHIKDLLFGEPGLTFVDNAKRDRSTFFKQVVAFRKQRYDVVVVLNRSFRSALIARIAGIPRRIGFPSEGRGILLTDRVPYDPIGFEGDCYAHLGAPLGLEVVGHPPRLTLLETEIGTGEGLRNGARIGLIPGSTDPSRAIPAAEAASIAESLGEPIALLGAGNERTFADALLPQLKVPAIDLVGKCTLRESMAAISGLSVVIGPDSGLIHVAAGLGVPTVATFTYTTLQKWGHHYAPHTVFQTPDRTMATFAGKQVVEAAKRVLA